jgi:hypothetical protein
MEPSLGDMSRAMQGHHSRDSASAIPHSSLFGCSTFMIVSFDAHGFADVARDVENGM